MWTAENIIRSMWPAVHRWFPTPVVAEQLRLEKKKRKRALLNIRKRRKSIWVKPWLQRMHLREHLMREFHAEDVTSLTNFMKMEPQAFHKILTRIAPRISKRDTNYRKALTSGLKLAITLRFLATGNSYKSLQCGFRVAHNSICEFILAVCQAIVDKSASSKSLIIKFNVNNFNQ